PHARVGNCQASNKQTSLIRKYEAFLFVCDLAIKGQILTVSTPNLSFHHPFLLCFLSFISIFPSLFVHISSSIP
ncbi:hypothetical protein, partial [Serratia proteamaculans]